MALISSKRNIKEVLSSAVTDDVQSEQSELKYENDANVFYFQQGEYLIPSRGQTLLLQNDSGELEQFVISNAGENLEEDDVSIDCYSPDALSTLSDSFNTENIEAINIESQEDANFIVANDETKYILNVESEDAEQSLYRFAILRDGKLHVQTLNVGNSKLSPEPNSLMEDSDDVLQKELAAFQKSISLDDLAAITPVDLNKITGKNLITGQTVTLDRYLDKVKENSSLKVQSRKPNISPPKKQGGRDVRNIINKRIAVGKTSDGKKLFGKIIQIQQPSVKMETDTEADGGSVKEVEKLESLEQPQVMIKKHLIKKEEFNCTIGKTLSGLMGLESIQRKIRNKNLIVKLIEKEFDPKSDFISKTVSYVYGCMARINEDAGKGDEVWTFILYNDKTSEDEDFNAYNETAFLTVLTIVDKCGRKSTKVNLNDHQSETYCYICKKEFKSIFQIRKHLNDVHFLNIFTKKKSSNDDGMSSTEKYAKEKWYQCVKCSKSFGTAGSLKRHLTVHDPSLRPLECSVCVNRFTDLSSLKKHLLIHTGIRAYICEICNRTFVNQGDLNFHRRIHDPIKQFSCTVCNREFSRYSNLMRHVEIHRGAAGALHRCDVCGCSYSFISSLTRHIVQKHIEKQ